MLDPRAIATLGIGYAPALVARLGLWPVDDIPEAPRVRGSGSAWRGVSAPRIIYRPIALKARGRSRATLAAVAEWPIAPHAAGATTAAISARMEAFARVEAAGRARSHLTAHAEAIARASALAARTEDDPAITLHEAAAALVWFLRH